MVQLQATKLSIELFANFRIEYEGKVLDDVNTARLQSLLAYLLLHPHAAQPRQYLAFLFWPDAEEHQAFTNLRNLLYKLRHALPHPECFLTIDGNNLQWRSDSSFRLDVAEFDVALSQAESEAELIQAVELYRGDLLPSCYDDWIRPIRERYQQKFVVLLERLINLLEGQRNYRSAIHYAQRLLQVDPLNETTVCTLMRLYSASADRASALRVYQNCAAALEQELEVEPSPETTELYLRLLHLEAEPDVKQTVHENWSLVGRHHEWQLMQALWKDSGGALPHLLVVSGEAGIGKTRLAEEFLEWVRCQGFVTATAHCYAAEGNLPYAPVVTWLRTASLRQQLTTLEPIWQSEVARLVPELLGNQAVPPSPIVSSGQRQRLFEALARAIFNSKKSLLLFIDDLQWCDRDTLEWLHYLLRYTQEAKESGKRLPNLLLMASVRSEELENNSSLAALLLALARQSQLCEITLGSLVLEETAKLATAVVGATLSPQENDLLYQESEGNPLFVVELMRAWQGNGLLSPSRRPVFATSQPLPPKVHAVIQTRLAQLSPAARELAGLAATIGRAFTLNVLSKASEQEQSELIHNLDELWQRRIVRERGMDRYDFAHDKLREVAYNSLSAAHRHLLHQHVAEALKLIYANGTETTTLKTELDTVSGQIATHYERAGLFAEAVPFYLHAAEVAQQLYANREAIEAYRRALALLEGPVGAASIQSASVAEKLGDLFSLTSQYSEARSQYLRLSASVNQLDRLDLARLQRKVGNTWREQYEYPQARQAYQAAEIQLGMLTESATEYTQKWWQEWVQIQLEVDLVHYWLAEIEESVELQNHLQPLVEQYGTLAQQATFFQRRSQLEFRRQRSVANNRALHYIQRSFALWQQAGLLNVVPSSYFMLGFTLLWHIDLKDEACGHSSNDLEAAKQSLTQALQSAEASADLSLQARSLTYLAIAQRRSNNLAETEKVAMSALAVASRSQMKEYIAMAKANLAWLAWRNGEEETVQTLGKEALELWHQLPITHASVPFQWTVLLPMIATALQDEEVEKAVNSVRTLLEPHQQKLPDKLTTLLEQSLQFWDQGMQLAALPLLHQAIAVAQQLHYL